MPACTQATEAIVGTLNSADESILYLCLGPLTNLKEFGGLNAEYFAHIRKLSIDYWLELDRRQIFDEFIGPVRYSLTW